jgi:hypothetical protein
MPEQLIRTDVLPFISGKFNLESREFSFTSKFADRLSAITVLVSMIDKTNR